jgi:hypothetical protein
MKNVDYKIEAFRLATLVLCQSATAGRSEKVPSTEDVMVFAKEINTWLGESIENQKEK